MSLNPHDPCLRRELLLSTRDDIDRDVKNMPLTTSPSGTQSRECQLIPKPESSQAPCCYDNKTQGHQLAPTNASSPPASLRRGKSRLLCASVFPGGQGCLILSLG